jgi:hypothetical protein
MVEQERRERAEGGVLGLNGYFWEQRSFTTLKPHRFRTIKIKGVTQPYFYFPLCGQLSLQELPVVSGEWVSRWVGT